MTTGEPGRGVSGRESPRHESPGHETTDANVRGITILGGALVVIVVVALGLMVWLFDYLVRAEAKHQPEPATLTARPFGQLPPEPRLQESPVGDLAQVRAEEDALLTSYGWVDRDHGVVRIPVEKAMEIVVQEAAR